MLVNVNMSREVYDYFKDYDLSALANMLLEQYDFTVLPQTSGLRDVERKVNVTDPVYIALYKAVGPRSKKISLGRLFEFAYNMDILSRPHFKIRPTKQEDNPVYSLVTKAYKAMLEAQKYSSDVTLKEVTEILYQYKEVIRNARTQK